MIDELATRANPLSALLARQQTARAVAEDEEGEVGRCAAFGYLRGARERATMLELRFRDGNRAFFPYSWLGPMRYDPSNGLLLHFVGDVTHAVLIEGSNLASSVDGPVDLVERGVARHRVLWVREMSEAEATRAEGGAVVDRIRVWSGDRESSPPEWAL